MSQADLMVVGEQLLAALHGQPSSCSMNQSRYTMFYVSIIVRMGGDVCHNLFTKTEDETEDEEHHNYDY